MPSIDSNKKQNTTYTENKYTSMIDSLRHEIDNIDSHLITLLHQRFDIVRQIGQLKNQHNTSIYFPNREKDIITKLLKYAETHGLYNLNKKNIEAIFYEIFSISRNIEKPQSVAFLGPIGSYTHQAAEMRFGMLSNYVSLSTISAVFEAMQNGNAKYGVIPLENNTNGMVGESIDNLAKYNFHIINEIILAIHHSFATHAQKLQDITKIYSKDIAFGQCRNFLYHYDLQHIEQIPVNSTADAARLASLDTHSAAICSDIAAKLYRVPVMFHKIQTSPNNQTRFVIIGADCSTPNDSQNSKVHWNNISNVDSAETTYKMQNKTSVFITIKDFEKSGSLFELLRDFKDENINITKIDSRPIGNKEDFRSGFYMDFYGHKEDDNIKRVFAKRMNEIKWLGSYPVFS